MSEPVSLWVAFGAGIASFLSPCILPLIPTYLTYLAGSALAGASSGSTGSYYFHPAAARARAGVLLNSLAFVAGFSLVFILLGLSASTVGRLLLDYQPVLRKLGAAVVIIFGLHLMEVLRLTPLLRERRPNWQPRQVGPAGSLLMGMAFSVGWTPCVGPVLGAILVYAGTAASVAAGGYLLGAYALGLALPFLLTAYFVGSAHGLTRRLLPWARWISVASGFLLVLMGVMLYNNFFFRLAGLVPWRF